MNLAGDLRKSVYQYAMMGLLNERVQAEISVDELLEKIDEQRKELVKSKEMKSDKTLFPDTEEEYPFDIPDTWRWVSLGSICKKIGAGSTPTGGKAVYKNTGIKFIREQNVYNSGLRLEDVAYISEDIHGSMKGSQVFAKDILMNITGASIGRTSLVDDDFDTANINQHVLIIRLVDERMRLYIHRCLCSPFVYDQMMKNQKGDKPGLSAQRVGSFMIPIPPLEEQLSIVKKLDEVTKEIDDFEILENQFKELQEDFPYSMEKSILQYALQGKITERSSNDSYVDDLIDSIHKERNQLIKEKIIKKENYSSILDDDEIPYDIPDTWRWVKFFELCGLVSGSDMKPEEYNAQGKGVPYLTGASNISDDGSVIINRWTEKPRSMAYRGDLLLTCKGTVGKMTFLEEEKVHIARQIMAIRPFGEMNKDYIYYCILNYVFYLKRKAKSMIPGIDRELVLNLAIPVPPVEEQQRIVDKLNEILPLCDDLKI